MNAYVLLIGTLLTQTQTKIILQHFPKLDDEKEDKSFI